MAERYMFHLRWSKLIELAEIVETVPAVKRQSAFLSKVYSDGRFNAKDARFRQLNVVVLHQRGLNERRRTT